MPPLEDPAYTRQDVPMELEQPSLDHPLPKTVKFESNLNYSSIFGVLRPNLS